MNNTEVMTKISGTFAKVGFQLKKHSPEILAVVGVVGTVASTVLACKATTKVSTIINDAKDDIEDVHCCLQNPMMADRYSEEDSKKDLTIIYAKTGVKIAKLYAPAIITGVVSLGCLLTSNNILRKRYIATAAAYATVDKSFKKYRDRVAERFGDEVEKEIRYNIKAHEVEETVTDEKGKTKKVKKTIQTIDGSDLPEYTRIFDELCPDFTKSPECNYNFLKAQQKYCNDRLIADTYLFLNDVYETLGFPKTEEGNVVGWLYDPNNPDYHNYVDFGAFDIFNEKARDFINGREPGIILQFNPDGIILDKAFGRKR